MAVDPRLDAILARIAGYERSVALYMAYIGANGRDFTGVANSHLLPEAEAIIRAINSVSADDGGRTMPRLAESANRLASSFGDRTSGIPAAAHTAIILATFREEITFHLHDDETRVRSLATRAFQHLQRSIVADEGVRSIWQDAFAGGETACESLGANHLLLHGIWAFKTSAQGERTDLVLGERLTVGADVRAASEGLVLTEWKLVRSPSDLERQISQAHHQASIYSESILAGFELARSRYLVLVSLDRLPTHEPIETDGITYRIVNIAVAPGRPSDRLVRRTADPTT